MVWRPERPRVLHRVWRHVVALLPDVHPSANGVRVRSSVPRNTCKQHINTQWLNANYAAHAFTADSYSLTALISTTNYVLSLCKVRVKGVSPYRINTALTCDRRTVRSTRRRPPDWSRCPPHTIQNGSAAAAVGRRPRPPLPPPRHRLTAAALASARSRRASAAPERRAREAGLPPVPRNCNRNITVVESANSIHFPPP